METNNEKVYIYRMPHGRLFHISTGYCMRKFPHLHIDNAIIKHELGTNKTNKYFMQLDICPRCIEDSYCVDLKTLFSYQEYKKKYFLKTFVNK